MSNQISISPDMAELCAQCLSNSGYEEAREMRALLAKPDAGISASAAPFAEKVLSKLRRTQACFEDGQGTDIGREWLDVLTRLGLLNRVQRSPGLWEITQQGEDLLRGQAAAQHQGEPAAIYQAEYRGDGGGGWSDVEYREYRAYLSNPEFNTRIVYTRPAESRGADTPTKDSAGALADALESSDWPGVSIGNKVLIAAAIQRLRAC